MPPRRTKNAAKAPTVPRPVPRIPSRRALPRSPSPPPAKAADDPRTGAIRELLRKWIVWNERKAGPEPELTKDLFIGLVQVYPRFGQVSTTARGTLRPRLAQWIIAHKEAVLGWRMSMDLEHNGDAENWFHDDVDYPEFDDLVRIGIAKRSRLSQRPPQPQAGDDDNGNNDDEGDEEELEVEEEEEEEEEEELEVEEEEEEEVEVEEEEEEVEAVVLRGDQVVFPIGVEIPEDAPIGGTGVRSDDIQQALWLGDINEATAWAKDLGRLIEQATSYLDPEDPFRTWLETGPVGKHLNALPTFNNHLKRAEACHRAAKDKYLPGPRHRFQDGREKFKAEVVVEEATRVTTRSTTRADELRRKLKSKELSGAKRGPAAAEHDEDDGEEPEERPPKKRRTAGQQQSERGKGKQPVRRNRSESPEAGPSNR
ncbi:hypothetical protein B0T16DRAFT_247476 [Cercophora newfieldiana]|uniref:Uncharacterized protein n=1 Tax=Cercophora newfieldiana TaxID=92897 RepID=A0AA39XV93_9PEZI|nr:hypothetical protein B0T16DRAFT_247476 [Cercophora newfieldiana]